MQGDEPPARSARRALEEAEELAVAGDGLVEDADLEAAEAAFRAALDKALVALGPGGDDSRATSVADSAITPRLYRALGEVSFLAGRYEAALHWLVQARDLDERNERPLALALDLTNTGVVRRHMGDLDGALADYRRVAEIEQQHEVSSVDRAITLNNMGRIHQIKGDLTAAQGLFDEALSLLEDTDAETMVIRSNFLGNVAGLHLDRGAFASAVDLYRQALDLVLTAAPRSKDAATCHNNLGRGYPFNRSSAGQRRTRSNRTNGHFGAVTSTNVGYLPRVGPLRWIARTWVMRTRRWEIQNERSISIRAPTGSTGAWRLGRWKRHAT